MGLKDLVYAMPPEKEYSERTAEAIDSEVKKITEKAYTRAKELIEANKDKLDNIAKALLKYETLDSDEVRLILEGGLLDKPTVTDLLAAEQAKSEKPKPKQEEQQEQSAN
jgi:cell division protease FtsH